jgi:hypothetical protein
MADRKKFGIRTHRSAPKNDKVGFEFFGDLHYGEMAGSDAYAGFGLEAGFRKLVGKLVLRLCFKLSVETLSLGIVRVRIVDRLEDVKKMEISAGLQ